MENLWGLDVLLKCNLLGKFLESVGKNIYKNFFWCDVEFCIVIEFEF